MLIRVLETRLQALCNAGELTADLHLSTGQEAIAVGVEAAIRPTDYIVSHHRTIGHALARGVPLEPLIAELLGKASGLNGGMAGEMHLSYLPKRFMFSFQLVGTVVSVGAGIAWAAKNYLKSDDIVVVFCGEAATANAQFHEGLNIAAVQKLPLLLVCENNHLAGNVKEESYIPVSPYERAAGYGVKSARVDGNNVEAVMEAASHAAHYVRTKCRPLLLDCDTTRLGRHKQGMGDRRTKEEMEILALRDPLRDVQLPPGFKEAMEAEIKELIESIQRSPDPVLRQ